ncbi:DUF2510 domain-containing protein [Cellulomonas sp.]|uniref:DUF2510 domain-containing protein n=1 Tax=Cellulomonas sp. TaxID=40001 RepID=UPI002D5F25EC|nr:DUF2510 domain-containing protein [Cellulomonas sp.]HYQ76177.1 DUF2510 domain-containing protein [Cellulomonas sp.]
MSAPEPGWYQDPTDPTMVGWWDGNQWTERRPHAPAPVLGEVASRSTARQPDPSSRRGARRVLLAAGFAGALAVGGVAGYLLGAGGSAPEPEAAPAPAPTVTVTETPDPVQPETSSGADAAAVSALALIREAVPAMASMSDEWIESQSTAVCDALRSLPTGSTTDLAMGFASTSGLTEQESYQFIGYSIGWKCPEIS